MDSEKIACPTAWTIRHLGEWVANHAPVDPDIGWPKYAAALMRYLGDGGREEWERACADGWPSAWRGAELDGYFDNLGDDAAASGRDGR